MINAQLTIRKVRLIELEAFYLSDEYKNMPVKPISPLRVASYLHNPRKIDNDFVLYLAYYKGEMVGFRTILHDQIYIQNAVSSFGWFSGNWVKPTMRRQSISFTLYQNVTADWQGRLMYTNYAPASKMLYDKSADFDQLVAKDGIRLYFNIAVYDLLAHRISIVKQLKCLVKLGEAILNTIIWPFRFFCKLLWEPKLKWVQIEQTLSDEMLQFLELNSSSVFNRSANEYRWIVDYPWIGEQNGEIDYPFSFRSDRFFNQFLVIKHDQNLVALAWMKMNEGKASLPFFYAQPAFENQLVSAVLAWTHKNNAHFFTVYHHYVKSFLHRTRFKALFSKSMNQTYFINKHIKSKFNIASIPDPDDGDGDVIFT